MYCPAHFEENRIDVLKAHIRQFPLSLIVTINDGLLNANHIPMLLCDNNTGLGTLQAHIPRNNPLWQSMNDARVLAIFQGENNYVSPNWYPTKHDHGKVVPTWNYITVHVRGNLKIIEDKVWLKSHLQQLTNTHESSQQTPWSLDDAPVEFIEKLINSIIGIELEITELSGKWKISQNQPAVNQTGVIKALNKHGHPLASIMESYFGERHVK